jgi:hypothetical protein
MSFVQGEPSNDKIPVALGLKGKNLYLSCVMKDGTPTLQLEVSPSVEKPPPLLTEDSAFTYFPDIHLPDPPENIRGLLDDLHKYRIKLA